MNCPTCGGAMSPKLRTHETRVGDAKVIDKTVMVSTCESCGTVSLSQDDLAGYERRAARVVLTSAEKVSGAALKFARKAMGLRQADLAAVLGSDASQVSRWENQAEIDRKLRLAVAALLDEVQFDPTLQKVAANPASEFEVLPLQRAC